MRGKAWGLEDVEIAVQLARHGELAYLDGRLQLVEHEWQQQLSGVLGRS
jgi:hypothetical protein